MFLACITACALGCASDPEPNPGEDPSEGGSDPGSGGATGVPIVDVIDDLDDGDSSIPETDGRVGAWFTFNDESSGGTQTPSPDGDFVPVAGGPGASLFMAQTTGDGFTVWGAGMGFDLNNPGDGSGGPGIKSTYDATGHTGVAFQAKGTVSLRVGLFVEAVVPEEFGGTCVPGTEEGEECNDAHGKDFVLGDAWEQYLLPFDEIAQSGWGQSATFDQSKLTGIQFGISEGVTFDVQVDEIGFY